MNTLCLSLLRLFTFRLHSCLLPRRNDGTTLSLAMGLSIVFTERVRDSGEGGLLIFK